MKVQGLFRNYLYIYNIKQDQLYYQLVFSKTPIQPDLTMATRSQIWKYFSLKDGNSDKAVCKTCDKEISCKGGTTSALHNHLKFHEDKYKELSEGKLKRKNSSSFSENPNKQPKIDAFVPKTNAATEKLLDEAIFNFLADSGIAFKVVEPDSFKNMFNNVNDK